MGKGVKLPVKYVFVIGAFVSLGVSIWMGYLEKHWVMGVAGAAFFVLLFADRLIEFSIGKSGLKAKMKEVDEVVDDAKATVDQLRLIAEAVGKTTASLVVRGGRMGPTFSDQEKDEIIGSIHDALREIGIPKERRQEVWKDSYAYTEFDYAGYVLGGSTTPSNASPEAIKEWKSLRSGGVYGRAGPDKIEHFLEKYNFLTEEVRERLEDHKYYVVHRTNRRPDEWAKRSKVPPLETLKQNDSKSD